MTDRKLYLAEGRLIVNAKGYWFTSGGEKGSFGYYPHLKDKDNFPIFPDTQIHGDLRMAVQWLCNINGKSDETIKNIFGSSPKDDYRNVASLFFVTDLELSKESKGRWNDKRFEIKARTEIEDEKRTVKEHMLVNLEMSYLDGLELEAKVYLGYYDDESELEEAKKTIMEAAQLLSGFGAFRSRGCGRGAVRIEWDEEHIFDYCSFTPQTSENSFIYTLTSKTNFRNKQIDPGGTQLLVSRPYITAEQLRGWFTKTYQKIFGQWPTIDEIASISFSALYPSIDENGKVYLGYPSAETTIKNEKNAIKDMAGRVDIREEDKEGEEAFFATKTKPLSASFVTNETKPRVITFAIEKRARNSIDEKFATLKEGGLFVQELIRKDRCFGGSIKIKDNASDFGKRARFIFERVKPVIKGCVFENRIATSDMPAAEGGDKNFRLAVAPFPYQPKLINFKNCKYEKQGDRITLKDANLVVLTTVSEYNTVLRRPRRPRIVVAPGSVICDNSIKDDNLLAWQGFGKDFIMPDDTDKSRKETRPGISGKAEFEKPNYFKDLFKDMTRSQAGIVKGFLNEKRDISEIKIVVEDRIAKYERKNKKGLKGLFENIKKYLEDDETGEKMRRFIDDILDELHKAWWDNKYSKK